MNRSDESNYDYTILFGTGIDSNGSVQVIDHYRNKKNIVGLTVGDDSFKCRAHKKFPSIIADLIDIAIAIHAADRLSFQNLQGKQTHIRVILPVRHPELFENPAFNEQLADLLEWTTGSRWLFIFEKRLTPGRLVEQQILLFPTAPEVSEVALWSGGLDALAGVYNRLEENSEALFMLFGTGSSDNTQARQVDVFKGLKPAFPNCLNLCQLPIRFYGSQSIHKNKISRARGVVFTFLGSACSYLMNQRSLCLYENGVGAINLPYRKSSVGLDHSRSVHPLTLLKVSRLISTLLKEEFRINNPFLFWTKAEMCKALSKDRRDELHSLTMSCDSPHRKKPIQCGYCSSCILRKQSLIASGIKDKTRYIVPHGKPPVGNVSLSIQHMSSQVSTLANLLNTSEDSALQWSSITRRFPILDDIVDRTAHLEGLSSGEMQRRLIRLYQTYTSEWTANETQILMDFPTQAKTQIATNNSLLSV